MDMLPIQPGRVDLIRPTIGTANDGGSKSQGGYMNVRDEDGGDTIELSDETKRLLGEDLPIEDSSTDFESLKKFFMAIIKAILNFFGIKTN